MATSAGPTPTVRATSHAAPTQLNLGPNVFGSDSDTVAGGHGGREERHLADEQFGKDHPLYEDLAPADSYLDGVYWVSPTRDQ